MFELETCAVIAIDECATKACSAGHGICLRVHNLPDFNCICDVQDIAVANPAEIFNADAP